MAAQLIARQVAAPGAELYAEVRGSGPVLLVVGQPMTSGSFAPLADELADRFTVVTYDPRGVGRSTVADRGLAVTPEVEGDDLARLIEDLGGGGPADVFGSSGGAVAGLALAARHPELVRVLVAHEPPVVELLPDAAHMRREMDEVRDAYRRSGPPAAWGRFVSLVMHDGPVGPDGVPAASWPPPGAPGGGTPGEASEAPPQPSAEQLADDEMFFLRMLEPFSRWVPPLEVLRAGGPSVVVAVGEDSRQEAARRSADALAAGLGTTAVRFPGGHGGFMSDVGPFADTLRRVLDAAP